MSSGLECVFIEPIEGRWYYILQDGSCPVEHWDWRDHATCYGGFKSFDEAHTHLHDNHTNPGGYSTIPILQFKMDETYERLIGNSVMPVVQDIYRPFRYRY